MECFVVVSAAQWKEKEIIQADVVFHSLSLFLSFFQTHICVEQTAIELLAKNLKVHIIADATTSRNPADRMFAFEVSLLYSQCLYVCVISMELTEDIGNDCKTYLL